MNGNCMSKLINCNVNKPTKQLSLWRKNREANE